MNSLLLTGSIIIVLSLWTIAFGAPFVPTKKRQIKTALNLLDLRKGQMLYDLGAGDGRVALAAAKRGLRVVGIELNFFLYLLARVRTWKYKNQITIKWQNYWSTNLDDADAVFVFSSAIFMKRLDKKLSKTIKPLRVVSFAFPMPSKKYIKRENGIFLYQY